MLEKDTSSGGIIEFNGTDIFEYLLGQNAPVMESLLIKYLTGKDNIPAKYEDLFKVHFSLYHALYLLKISKGKEGFYLHLDPMRIRLIKLPENGKCSVYFPESGSFCGRNAGTDNFCRYHERDRLYGSGKVFYDPLYEFYINPENIVFCNDRLIKKVMKGVITYSLRKGEIQKAIDFFGLTHPDKKIIKKRYHELAKLYHPDTMNGDDTMMKKLNISYRILTEVYVL